MKTCALFAASLLSVVSSLESAAVQTSARPNIIVIYTDDHGYADIVVQGSVTDIKTPSDSLPVSNKYVHPGVAMHRARSVAFWIRLPTESAEFGCNCILSWGVPEPRQKWEMVWNRNAASGQVGALRVDFGRGYLVGNTDLRDGLWHHIAVVFYGGDHTDVTTHLKLYVDGRLETTTGRRSQQIETATTSDRSIPVTLGRYMDHRKKIPRSYFVGQIDELFIVEDALNPRQIVMLRESNQFQKNKPKFSRVSFIEIDTSR